jgi:hypothetical protein
MDPMKENNISFVRLNIGMSLVLSHFYADLIIKKRGGRSPILNLTWSFPSPDMLVKEHKKAKRWMEFVHLGKLDQAEESQFIVDPWNLKG